MTPEQMALCLPRNHYHYDNDRNDRDDLDIVIAQNVADLRHDVSESEARLKDTIHTQSLSNGQEFCAVNKNVSDVGARTSDHLANMERDLQNRIFESQKEALMANKDLTVRIMTEAKDTNKNIADFKDRTDDNFCEVKGLINSNTQLILKQLYDNKLDEKNDIIAELRTDCKLKDQNLLIANELSGLKQLINSVEQTQRFNSKTVQFGAGNVAIPTQTANQG